MSPTTEEVGSDDMPRWDGGLRRACWAATRVWAVRWGKTKRYKKKKRNRNGFSVHLGIWVGKI